MKLRILYHHRTRAMDGQAVHVRELLSAMRGLGHEVKEVALVARGEGSPRSNGSAGPLWSRLRLPRFAQEIGEHLYTPFGKRMLLRAARGFRPDLVYERYAMSCGAGVEAAARLEVPCFLEVNSPMCLEMERLGLLRFRSWARAAERSILGRADRVFTVSGPLRDLLVADGVSPERIVVCHNGTDPDRFSRARDRSRELRADLPPEGRTVLGFLGFPREWHRIDLCLEAMAALLRRGRSDLFLLVVGDGPARAEIEAAASRLGLEGRVRFTGVVAREDLPAWVGLFHIAVIPAINEYASPLKLFDAMAAGIPVVAPDQPNLREVVEHGREALLFRPGDSAALAEAIERLAADTPLREEMGERARARILDDDRTWRGNARRIVEELVASRASR